LRSRRELKWQGEGMEKKEGTDREGVGGFTGWCAFWRGYAMPRRIRARTWVNDGIEVGKKCRR